jgi:hypothetical protein
MALGRFRVALGLVPKKPLFFLSQCNGIYTALEANKTIFVSPNPPLTILQPQIQSATAAQQLVSTGVNGAAEARTVQFGLLITMMENERMMVQGLCDASPSQAAAIAASAAMRGYAIGSHHKPIIGLKTSMPVGTVLAEANAGLLDSTSRQKTYNWGLTLDGGKTFLPLPSTPEAKTSIANLTPLTTIGVQVSVTVAKHPQGPWSPVAYILVR